MSDESNPSASAAEVAYSRFKAVVDEGERFPHPAWDKLPDKVRRGWEAAIPGNVAVVIDDSPHAEMVDAPVEKAGEDQPTKTDGNASDGPIQLPPKV